jgi:hypothetical protein
MKEPQEEYPPIKRELSTSDKAINFIGALISKMFLYWGPLSLLVLAVKIMFWPSPDFEPFHEQVGIFTLIGSVVWVELVTIRERLKEKE